MDRKMTTLLEKSKKIQQQIHDFRESCPHHPEEVRYKHESDTGNWCRSDDCYWTDLYCSRCGKMWRENGSSYIKGALDLTYSSQGLKPEE